MDIGDKSWVILACHIYLVSSSNSQDVSGSLTGVLDSSLRSQTLIYNSQFTRMCQASINLFRMVYHHIIRAIYISLRGILTFNQVLASIGDLSHSKIVK